MQQYPAADKLHGKADDKNNELSNQNQRDKTQVPVTDADIHQ